ncbi:unnamed protein product [Rotaria magnacalcarata]|uniref:F-box domain-containing protein n=1 Tax=Rotaria magnacalcarata TaxID=392030 RepID=A0A816UB33_9BILA|nr:unnamed protein product [Rotaria magnacalcarata]
MNISMSSTHFISLPDVVLLEIFGYLSCEDVLCAFADSHDIHLIDLLIEHGSFRHICLSSQLSRHQYEILSQGSWRYDLVHSLVCKEMFSDFISDLAPCKIFSSLTDLRLLSLRCPSECLSENDERNIRICFVLCLNTSIIIDSSDIANISDIRSASSNEIFLKHNNEDNSKLYLTWFSQLWPSWTTFWMYHRDVAPRNGVRELGITASNTSLHSIGKLFPNVKELMCTYPASLSMANSSLTPTPLVNVLQLTVLDVVSGLELLLDGIMLPRLRSIRGMIVPLFVTLARRTNQMRTLDTIDHLEITDQNNGDERSFSFKQWYMLLDAVPRLRTLLFQFHNAKCPPIALADLFIDYIRRTIRTPLTLFSCCIDDVNDINSKEHFITRLEEGINMVRPSIQFASISSTRLYAWM